MYDYPEGSQTADAFGFPLLNDSGQIAFYGNLPSVGQYQFGNGIWRATENSLDAMAVRGSEVGGVAGAVFTGLGPSPRLNASGQLAFGGGFSGPGVSALNNGGVLIDSNGSSTLIARKGDSAPNLASVQFAGISQPALNDAGEASFYATLSGASVTSLNDRSIWSTAGGGLNLVARSDEVAPGSGGARFDLQSSDVKINALGETLFSSSLQGSEINMSNRYGMWATHNGSTTLVARHGDAAPGLDGAQLMWVDSQSAVFNSRNQIAFRSDLVGASVTSSNDSAIWVRDVDGQLRMIVRSGDMIEVSPGDSRAIEELHFNWLAGTGNDEGRPSGFNDLGQVAFRVTFVDGSQGIVVSNLVAVPEPSSILPIGIPVAILLASYRFGRNPWRCN